jgi:uncharacterized OB-fold protein
MSSDWLVVDALAPDVDDVVLATLYESAARGELALPFCGSCDQPLELGQQVCDACRSTRPVWREVERRGVVHSATLVHRLEKGLVITEAPYPVVDVELASGHRLVMTTVQASSNAPDIGTAVVVGFRLVGAVHIPAAAFSPRGTDPSTEALQ